MNASNSAGGVAEGSKSKSADRAVNSMAIICGGVAARSAPLDGGTAMEMRGFGRTGLQLSVLGFGCGAGGGLIVRGDPLDQERTIARAIAAGVNYFDTAVQYGDGESERNLGRVLQRLKPANAVVGTKVRLPSSDFGRIADAVAKSLE